MDLIEGIASRSFSISRSPLAVYDFRRHDRFGLYASSSQW